MNWRGSAGILGLFLLDREVRNRDLAAVVSRLFLESSFLIDGCAGWFCGLELNECLQQS